MNLIESIVGAFQWLWNGLANVFNIFRWFWRESYRLKGLWITTIFTSLKLSYDAVISGINEALAELQNTDITANASAAINDFLQFANAVFPLEEMLAGLVALIHLGAMCLIIRAIRSVKVRVFG